MNKELSTEIIILNALMYKPSYTREFIFLIESKYFNDSSLDELYKFIFGVIYDYYKDYHKIISYDELCHEVNIRNTGNSKLKETFHEEALPFLKNELTCTEEYSIDITKKFIQNRIAILLCNDMIDTLQTNPNDGIDKFHHLFSLASKQSSSIDDISIGVDSAKGNNKDGLYTLDTSNLQWEYYHSPTIKYDFLFIKKLSYLTNGGIPRGTLNLIAGGINVGKTMSLVNMTKNYVAMGLNVLYVSLEMSENEIRKRVDACFTKTHLSDLQKMSKDDYIKTIKRSMDRFKGRLAIKQIPSSGASVLKFQGIMDTLYMKHELKIDVLVIDYLGLAKSVAYKSRSNAGSNEYFKSVAEELRSMAVENNIIIWSATQLNRDGQRAGIQAELTNMSDSIGVGETADYVLLLDRTDNDLLNDNKAKMKEIKTRYGARSNEPFIIDYNPFYQTIEEGLGEMNGDVPVYVPKVSLPNNTLKSKGVLIK